jgi:cytolysin (calcineurin-like family phosphatase)
MCATTGHHRTLCLAAFLLVGCARGADPAGRAPDARDAGRDAPADRSTPTPAPSDGAAQADVPVDMQMADPPDAPADLNSEPPAAAEGGAGAELDVTFFAFGDPQYGGGPGDKNSFHVQALNAAPDLAWPADAGLRSAGRKVGPPRGVVIAGDLTQNGQAGRNPLGEWYTGEAHTIDVSQAYGVAMANPRISAELGLFLRDYGLAGNDGLNLFKLKWPVYEGYGNHDFDVLERFAELYAGRPPAVDIVSVRNQVRSRWPGMRRFAPAQDGHYSWDWDSAHFVQLNLAGADMPGGAGMQRPRNPRNALQFLRQDLLAEVGDSCRPVLIIMHYGFDAFSAEARWWDAEQRQLLLDVLRPYNVVAILHGHVHETRAYTVSDGGKRYDVFSLGSPYYEGQPTNDGRGHFAVFRLAGRYLDAADVSWSPANPVPQMANNRDLWTGKRVADLRFQTTTRFADGWGGWSVSRETDGGVCPRP